MATAVRLAAGQDEAVEYEVMKSFCPDGYIPAKEAIDRAGGLWFAEQIAAITNEVAEELGTRENEAEGNALAHVGRALSGRPAVSEGLQQKVLDLVIQIEHRMRNALHQGVLTAFYFDGFFDAGPRGVARGFWATTDADDALGSGHYWPFAKAKSWHEQRRPSFQLFFLETELAALLTDQPKPPHPTADTTNVLGAAPVGGASHDESFTTRQGTEGAGGRARSKPALERAHNSIRELFPEGTPDQSALPNGFLCRRVHDHIRNARIPSVSDDTILRAAGRRK